MKLSTIKYFVCFLLFINLIACKKLVEIDAPVTSVNSENVFNNDQSAISTLTGIYTSMSIGSSVFTGTRGTSLVMGLSADDWTLHSGVTDSRLTEYYRNALSVTPSRGSEFWSPLYKVIYQCNAVIEGINKSKSMSAKVKQQLSGEAKFIRAFTYFYLVNLYGDVPLALTTEFKENSVIPRSTKDDVYKQIVNDLKDAEGLLDQNFLDGSLNPYSGTPERARPTKWAAAAMLARVYLYTGDYLNAETQAGLLINNPLFSLSSLNSTFLKNSSEAIWQLQPVTLGWNTEDARIFIIPTSGFSASKYPVYLSTFLLNSFEPGDNRITNGNWVKSVVRSGVTYICPYKYKSATLNSPVTEYLMVLRLAEQYLIRAEARVQLNNISGAQSDLNAIRIRAGLSPTTASDKTSLLAAIAHERQVELFTEWGHRWLDLKRTGKIDGVMTTVTPIKANGAAWQSFQQLYPIPLTDIERNGNLSQNSGYK